MSCSCIVQGGEASYRGEKEIIYLQNIIVWFIVFSAVLGDSKIRGQSNCNKDCSIFSYLLKNFKLKWRQNALVEAKI